MSALQLRPNAPFRPTDWRWEKARLMREDQRTALLLRHQDDDWTRKAKKFQEALAAADDDYAQLLVIRKWPDLWDAHCLRHREDDKRLVRYEIEARLLANDPLERIAERTGIAPNVVIWYEKLFFNVADRLANKSWIAHCVIGEAAQAGLNERDYDALWKTMGYCGGGLVIDAVVDTSYDVTRPENAGQTEQWINDDIRRVAGIKMGIGLRTMAVNNYTMERISEIYLRFEEMKRTANVGGAGDMLTSNIQVMLQHIPWTIGDRRVLVMASDPKTIVGRLREEVAAADDCAVELRASELMQLNTGQQPERTRALAAFKFPDKPTEKTDVAQ